MIRKYLSSDRVAVRSKLAQKYDKTAENEVITWIEQLTGVKLEAGIYKLGRQMKNGQTLVKLAQRIQKDTPVCPEAAKNFQLKLNTDNAPFKQMENIQVFLGFCERYGVPVSGLFHTKDLYDGNNMQQVLASVIRLGTESQRNHFNGPTIGPKPQEKNIRDFSDEKMKASHSFLAMQSGKCGPSLDFQIGAARRIVDSRTEGGMGGKGVKTAEVVNGVPDLLDIRNKGKKNSKSNEAEGEGKKEKINGKEKKEREKNGREERENEDSEEEKEEEVKTPPVVKNKPEKKDEESKSEKKRRERKKEKAQEKAQEKDQEKAQEKDQEKDQEKEQEKDEPDEEEKKKEKKKLAKNQKSVDGSEKDDEEGESSEKNDKIKRDKK